MRRVIVMLALLAAPAVSAQDGAVPAAAPPSLPTDPNGWVREIQIADKLTEAGYVDQAQTDYEAIIRKYPSNVAGIDRAWMGLARVHMGRGEIDLAKVALESVLGRNSDLQSVLAAKAGYRQLVDQAQAQMNQAYQLVQFLEYRNMTTPWFDLFTKLFNWFDLRSARKKLDEAAARTKGFDPHFLIDVDGQASATATPTAATAGGPAGTITQSHTAPPAPSPISPNGAAVPTASPASSSRASGTAAAVPTAPPAPAVVTLPSAAPAGQLVDLQRNYQEAYRKLQEAIASGNQTRTLEANGAYQSALEAYRKAAGSVGR